MKTLIGMTDFVFEIGNLYETTHRENLATIYNYAMFLKQPLELWMFVPCKLVDGVWVVLEEPKNDYYLGGRGGVDAMKLLQYEQKLSEYQQAKERCLFEVWNIVDKIDATICIENESKHRLFLPNCMAIEDIIYTDMQLTQTAIKQLSL